MVLVLDVGPTMHAILPEIEKVCSMLIEKKVCFGPSNSVQIVVDSFCTFILL